MEEIRLLGPGDSETLMAASHLFDSPARPDAAIRFLAEPGHHLLLGLVDGVPAGFVSGVEMTHPDKGTEMFLYELAVDPTFQRRGIGRALTEALASLAQTRGCYGMFVLTDEGNAAALATYRRAGAGDPKRCALLSWSFDRGAHPGPAAEDSNASSPGKQDQREPPPIG
jgi:GNAT superfamily N-acetyltransferase